MCQKWCPGFQGCGSGPFPSRDVPRRNPTLAIPAPFKAPLRPPGRAGFPTCRGRCERPWGRRIAVLGLRGFSGEDARRGRCLQERRGLGRRGKAGHLPCSLSVICFCLPVPALASLSICYDVCVQTVTRSLSVRVQLAVGCLPCRKRYKMPLYELLLCRKASLFDRRPAPFPGRQAGVRAERTTLQTPQVYLESVNPAVPIWPQPTPRAAYAGRLVSNATFPMGSFYA